MNQSNRRFVIIFATMLLVAIKGNSQTVLPVELTKNSLKEQITYIEEHTRIYENYRAVREDMFQVINKNILDSIALNKSTISGLKKISSDFTHVNDSLNSLLETTRKSLEETVKTKNQIRVLGLDINKLTYNNIMWIIVAGLVLVLALGFFIFKRYLFLNIRTGKELKELKEEYEAYKQSSRIAREKMAMDHFNELRKLKGQ